MKGYITKSIIFLIIIVACLQTVSATSPIPESYWGYATINGAPVANGTLITVEIHDTGQIIESTTVQYQNGGYSLNVEFDDPNTSEEGADEGDKLTWKLGGILCATPAPSTDTAISGKVNSNFNLVSDSNEQPIDTSKEMPVDNNPNIPGFSFIGVIFVLFIVIQILRM